MMIAIVGAKFDIVVIAPSPALLALYFASFKVYEYAYVTLQSVHVGFVALSKTLITPAAVAVTFAVANRFVLL